MKNFSNKVVLGLSLTLSTCIFAQGHAGHTMPAAPVSNPHAGHTMPAAPAPVSDPHAGHTMPAPTTGSTNSGETFSTSVVGLPDVVPTSEVRLPDGADYVMEAKAAKQKIGAQYIRRLAYNGSVPGPIIRVKQGSSINLTLKNSTEVATTLHPHGLRLDYRYDGVPGVGQNPIATGESFEYKLDFPDAGIYWYHPHVREDYSQEAGLYGVFIVEPKNPNVLNPVHREIPLVLDDVLIDPKQPFSKDKATHTLMGRFGNVNLVNGVVNPTLAVTKGETVRFYVLNTSNTRVFAFAIPNTKLKVVGGDNGLYESEFWSEKVILGPGERTIVEAQFTEVGAYAVRNNKPKNPVSIAQISVQTGTVKALASDFNKLRVNTAAVSDLAAVRSQLAKKADKGLTLTVEMDHNALPMDMGGMNHSGNHSGMNMGAAAQPDDGIEWDDDMAEMNAASNTDNVVWKMVDTVTKRANMDIDWTFAQGQFVKIRIFNDPSSMHPMQHPIHFHGQRFVVSSVNGKPTANLVWKDTTLVPAGSTVDIILETSNPGQWMSHCHISEHMEAQMMFEFKVQ